jgi:type IV fimbrial biogenesis protein FimT
VHPVSARFRLVRHAGFTLVETMVVLAIFAILMAVGVPNMRAWLGATTSTGAAQFYAEGYTLARSLALTNNARSRLVFTGNAQSGQRNWQVDVCFPTAGDDCAAASSRWSDVDKQAVVPGGGAVKTSSVFRSAESLPRVSALKVTPDGDASAAYFTALGWIDTSKPSLTRLDLTPAGGGDAFPASAVVVTLAGAVVTCRPSADAGDSRRCP